MEESVNVLRKWLEENHTPWTSRHNALVAVLSELETLRRDMKTIYSLALHAVPTKER